MSGATRAEERAPTPIDAAWSDEHAVDVLFDLVATPSVSGNERAAVERFVMHARALGMEAEIDEAGSGVATREEGTRSGGERNSQMAKGQMADEESGTRGTGGEAQSAAAPERAIEIVLLGHIDTVAGEIAVRMEGEQTAESDTRVLHGRGSVDAKGPLAAMLVAAARATLPEGVTVRVCGAVGEETPHSRGARHIARTFRPDACIIGEPSGWDGFTLGYKGRLVASVQITQASTHSAGPEGSAGDSLIDALARLRQTAHEASDGARVFDRVQMRTLSVHAGSDGLHESAEAVVSFRLPRSVEPAAFEAALRRDLAGVPGCEVNCRGHEPAYVADRGNQVARALSVAIRGAGATPRPLVKTGTCDMNVVGPAWNCPIAAYGPGDSSLDHTPIEHISISEYLASVAVLTVALEDLARTVAR